MQTSIINAVISICSFYENKLLVRFPVDGAKLKVELMS